MRIGILGGGQLAQMMIQSPFGERCEFTIYSAQPATPTQNLAPQIIAPFEDTSTLEAFAKSVDVVTFETENIPLETVSFLEKFVTVHPKVSSLKNFQDRLLEKKLFNQLEIPTNQFMQIDTHSCPDKAASCLGYPFIIKSRRDGYDGKNQWKIQSEKDLNAFKKHEKIIPSIAEAFVPFEREVSIVGVRDVRGNTSFYDLCENVHAEGILRYTRSLKNDPLQKSAEKFFTKLAEAVNHVGVMTIEFFVHHQGLLANEVAPRVHNSGHWTIEGAKTSQFENHLRVILGKKAEDTTTKGHALMYNFVGDYDYKPELEAMGMIFHDYQKIKRVGRKLAHGTFVEANQKDVEKIIESFKSRWQ